MIFYKYTYTTNGEPVAKSSRNLEGRNSSPFCSSLQSIAQECSNFCENLNDITLYISGKTENHISIICVYTGALNEIGNIDKKVDELILYLNLDFLIYKKEELTLNNFIFEMETSADNNYIKDCRSIKDKFGLNIRNGAWFRERKLDVVTSKKEELLNICDEIIVDECIKEEVERIFTPQKQKEFGVPVHYLLNIHNFEDCDKVINILIKSLKLNNRMLRDVYTIFDLTVPSLYDRITFSDVSKLFNINQGGVVVIKADMDIANDDVFSIEKELINIFTSQIKHNSTEVTTILCCVGKNKSLAIDFQNKLTDLLFVEINDTTLSNERAKKYLLNHAKHLNIADMSGLTDMIVTDISYKPNDLLTIFRKWHKSYVKTIQFPQYSQFVGKEYKLETKGKQNISYQNLNSLIGLNGVKEVINNYLNYAKLQKACIEEGKPIRNTCKHMCFVGNPGTAKTTVARIVAQVMKENGILSKGNLIEVGRADIVSRFVGGTAPNVQEIFKKAVGNVLFIDEAYSLCDGKQGLYGDEAINAIVQEMENKREDVVVIFAGYKKEMQSFLDKNSGLKSRIAYTIEFPDYSEDELLEITKHHAKNLDIDISLCEDKIKNIISIGKNQENFGNGRFVRSMLEKARMKQAGRLIMEDKLFGENLRILKPDDFEISKPEEKVKMGFC